MRFEVDGKLTTISPKRLEFFRAREARRTVDKFGHFTYVGSRQEVIRHAKEVASHV